jgi:heterodisulfide reductase subunit B2
MKLTYYPGCSLHSTAVEYHESACAVFEALGVELAELDDWNCCGATPAHAINHHLSLALPLRNLVLAEKAQNDVVAPCAACYNVMKFTDNQVRRQTADAQKVNAEIETIMGAKYGATIQIRHPLEIFGSKEMLRTIAAKVARPLTGLKVVTYYGCLLTRPKDIVAFDNPEQPEIMDKVLAALGTDVRRWSYKTDCCGGSLALSQTAAVETLVAKLVSEAERAGAQAIVSACPLCQVTLDTRQDRVSNKMPIFYFTELMGVSFGVAAAKNWLGSHIIDPVPLLSAQAKKGVI